MGVFLCVISRLAPLPTLLHSGLTRLQRGLFGASLLSFPYPVLKPPHGAVSGRVWASTFLSGTVFGQHRKFPLQFVLYRFLDGTDSVEKVAVAHKAYLGFYLRGFRIDQPFFLPAAECTHVGTHASMLADPSNAWPALMGCPILSEHQVGVNRQLAGAQSQREDLIRQKEIMPQWASLGVSVFDLRGVTSKMFFRILHRCSNLFP
jgi:hypothetical protein